MHRILDRFQDIFAATAIMIFMAAAIYGSAGASAMVAAWRAGQ